MTGGQLTVTVFRKLLFILQNLFGIWRNWIQLQPAGGNGRETWVSILDTDYYSCIFMAACFFLEEKYTFFLYQRLNIVNIESYGVFKVQVGRCQE